ncbi:MAG: dUTP diphosphatase [candidate division WOR-3 bacterium]
MKPLKVRILRLKENACLPYRATSGAAGFDLFAAESAVIKKGGFGGVGTGIAIELPEGMEAQIRPRSGLALHCGIGILNSPGTIDSDYRGEIRVVLFNVSRTDFVIKPGDRIAQIVFTKTVPVKFEEVTALSPTKRSTGGFGHTGTTGKSQNRF